MELPHKTAQSVRVLDVFIFGCVVLILRNERKVKHIVIPLRLSTRCCVNVPIFALPCGCDIFY